MANQILVDDVLDIIRRGRDDDVDERWSTVGDKVVSFNVPERDNGIVSDWISRLETDLNESGFSIFLEFVEGTFSLMMMVVWSSTGSSSEIICGAVNSRRDLFVL